MRHSKYRSGELCEYAGRATSHTHTTVAASSPPVAAPTTAYGRGLSHLRLQPQAPTVAASATYGCSLGYVRLQVRRLLPGRVAGRGVGGALRAAWADPRDQHGPGAGVPDVDADVDVEDVDVDVGADVVWVSLSLSLWRAA